VIRSNPAVIGQFRRRPVPDGPVVNVS